MTMGVPITSVLQVPREMKNAFQAALLLHAESVYSYMPPKPEGGDSGMLETSERCAPVPLHVEDTDEGGLSTLPWYQYSTTPPLQSGLA